MELVVFFLSCVLFAPNDNFFSTFSDNTPQMGSRWCHSSLGAVPRLSGRSLLTEGCSLAAYLHEHTNARLRVQMEDLRMALGPRWQTLALCCSLTETRTGTETKTETETETERTTSDATLPQTDQDNKEPLYRSPSAGLDSISAENFHNFHNFHHCLKTSRFLVASLLNRRLRHKSHCFVPTRGPLPDNYLLTQIKANEKSSSWPKWSPVCVHHHFSQQKNKVEIMKKKEICPANICQANFLNLFSQFRPPRLLFRLPRSPIFSFSLASTSAVSCVCQDGHLKERAVTLCDSVWLVWARLVW